MEILQAVLLGIIQGISEFLPISSSGHLRVFQELFGLTDEFGLVFDTWLHVATLAAVVVYFRTDLFNMVRSAFSSDPERSGDKRLAWLVVVATIPTGLIGLAGGDFFETADILYVGIAFLITATALTLADLLSRRSVHEASRLGWGRAILVGVAQGIAVMPGISRAGATMAAGLGLGLDREQAARFSFLLSGPIILLAGARQGVDIILTGESGPELASILVGSAAAAITGYFAIAG
ncbi:MAG: undecaprenyl-diphosphate phosphatase, partial [Actinomycetota bacterium]|nr:undecaprenyl-diphosphate phosphatase [Actinomycetota bacterium]